MPAGDEALGEVEDSETTSEANFEREGSMGGLGRSILSAAADATAIAERKKPKREDGDLFFRLFSFGGIESQKEGSVKRKGVVEGN